MVKVKEDLTGKRFNRLLVIKQHDDYIYKTKQGKVKRIARWFCKCDCGNYIVSNGYDLKSNHTKSCGCLNRETTANRNKANKKLNNFVECDDYFLGISSKGDTFKVDKDIYPLIKEYTWWKNKNGYFETHINDERLFLHRLIANTHGLDHKKVRTDHINSDKSDNRKQNLRIVTPSQNAMNSKVRKDSTTKITGVHYSKRYNRYQVNIGINGKTKYLGFYKTLEEAVKVRKEAEIKYFGKYRYKSL